jgi:alpha/beta superfamily hydrolase
LKLEERAAEISSGALRLDARVHEGRRDLVAVVLHPHPQYGGDMDNHVVLAVCDAFAAAGASTVRFNFRGVGRSEGAYEGGHGEADDARAVIGAVRAWWPEARVVLAGYSFGAAVAASVASWEGVGAILVISPPASLIPEANLPEGLRGLVVTGAADPLAPASELGQWSAAGRQLVAVPGAGHSWWPGVDLLSQAVGDFALELARSDLRNA